MQTEEEKIAAGAAVIRNLVLAALEKVEKKQGDIDRVKLLNRVMKGYVKVSQKKAQLRELKRGAIAAIEYFEFACRDSEFSHILAQYREDVRGPGAKSKSKREAEDVE